MAPVPLLVGQGHACWQGEATELCLERVRKQRAFVQATPTQIERAQVSTWADPSSQPALSEFQGFCLKKPERTLYASLRSRWRAADCRPPPGQEAVVLGLPWTPGAWSSVGTLTACLRPTSVPGCGWTPERELNWLPQPAQGAPPRRLQGTV